MDDIIAVITDLFFAARIRSAAAAGGRTVRFVPAQGDIDGGFALALVDLDAGVDVEEVIRRLKAIGSGPVVAFGPHLDTDRRKAAKAAGADRVLAKSKFVTDLPRMLQETAGAPARDA